MESPCAGDSEKSLESESKLIKIFVEEGAGGGGGKRIGIIIVRGRGNGNMSAERMKEETTSQGRVHDGEVI